MALRVLYLCGGLVFLGLAVGACLQPSSERRRYDAAALATADLVEIETDDYAEGAVHHAVVRFDAGPGHGVVTARVWVPDHTVERMTAGQQVRIRYDARKPDEVWLEGHTDSPSLLGVVFLLFCAAGALAAAFR
jgi:hypothetical protein